MSNKSSYLIIGNGIAGVTAAEILRSEDTSSAITMIADDPFPVYYRPALKDFLTGRLPEEKLWARPTTFYQENRIRFIPGHVTHLNPLRHQVRLQSGQQISYHKLLLANGARPRRLRCPGMDLAGVTTLRTIADYKEVQRQLGHVSRIVICGGGPLALESAETLSQRGYQVTQLLNQQKLWPDILDRTASDLIQAEERRVGITVRAEETIREIVGNDGHVSEVITTKGEHIPCEMVLIAIGIEPMIDFVRASGISCGRGVKVDTQMRTSATNIYAAGDITETTSPTTGQTRVVGQWFPAIQQARIAAWSMLDAPEKHQAVYHIDTFYNATLLFGLQIVTIGLTQPPQNAQGYQELIADPKPRNYRKIILKEGVPQSILFLGERTNASALKRAIDNHVNLSPVLNDVLRDDFDLNAWLDQHNVPELVAPPRQQEVSNNETRKEITPYLVPIPHPKINLPIGETRLKKQENLLGRMAEASVALRNSSISRRHAIISVNESRYTIRDLHSANGTFINNVRLAPERDYTLRENDLLRLGDLQFRFQLRNEILSSRKEPVGPVTNKHYIHLQGTQLHANASRLIPAKILAGLGNQPTLVLVAQGVEPQVVDLQKEQRYTIGRDKTCAIVLQDTAASRQHAELFHTQDGFYIRDLDSSNGVFINKARINNAHHLAHGDRIVVGNTLIYCSFPKEVDTQEPFTDSQLQRAVTGPLTQPPVIVGAPHRTDIDIRKISRERINFEIDMCIGCDRCMEACPIPMSSMVNIADLNQATISDKIATHIARFTHECIMCGSCVPVCPVDDHRDLLMLSLKQRIGVPWNEKVDMLRIADVLPPGWNSAKLLSRLREQPILGNPELVPENYLLHLAIASQLLPLEPGVTLIQEGKYERDLFLILEGRLSVSSKDMHENELQIAILSRGEYVGDYGLLTGQPSNISVYTLTPAFVLRVPEQVIQRFMELVPKTRHFFEQLNNARSVQGILKRMALFQGIREAETQTLVEQAQIKQYERNTRILGEDGSGEYRSRDTLLILLEGFVKVARKTTRSQANPEGERVIAYRQGGDYFFGGLDQQGDGKAVTVTTITRTRIAEVPKSALQALFQRHPEVKQRFTMRLQEYAASTRDAYSMIFNEGLLPGPQEAPRSDPAARAGLHSLVKDGVVEGTEVLLIDLDKCIHCNECEEACARRHGHSRMNRKGMVVGNISIATACRHCQDPVCLICSRAGIGRLPNGEVYITENCIGCGICAERCPYGAISIVNIADELTTTRNSWQRFNNLFTKGTSKEKAGKPLPMLNGNAAVTASGAINTPDAYEEMRKKVAIKCDLCAGYKDQACVQACPTGAAIRVQPTKFFGSTEKILQQRPSQRTQLNPATAASTKNEPHNKAEHK